MFPTHELRYYSALKKQKTKKKKKKRTDKIKQDASPDSSA